MCAKDILKILGKIIELHDPCVTIVEDESIPNRFYIENDTLKLNDIPLAEIEDIFSICFRIPFERKSGKVMFVIKMRRFVMCITFSKETEEPEIVAEYQFKEYYVFADGRKRFEEEVAVLTDVAENLVFNYTSTKNYYRYHEKYISDFIARYDENPGISDLKRLYADIAFINDEANFDKTLAISLIKSYSSVLIYLRHLDDYSEIIDECDLKKIIDDVIEHEKTNKSATCI